MGPGPVPVCSKVNSGWAPLSPASACCSLTAGECRRPVGRRPLATHRSSPLWWHGGRSRPMGTRLEVLVEGGDSRSLTPRKGTCTRAESRMRTLYRARAPWSGRNLLDRTVCSPYTLPIRRQSRTPTASGIDGQCPPGGDKPLPRWLVSTVISPLSLAPGPEVVWDRLRSPAIGRIQGLQQAQCRLPFAPSCTAVAS